MGNRETATGHIVSQETARGIARVLPNHGHQPFDCAFCAAVGTDLEALADEIEALRRVVCGLLQDDPNPYPVEYAEMHGVVDRALMASPDPVTKSGGGR